MEHVAGIEPAHNSFAESGLTTWLNVRKRLLLQVAQEPIQFLHTYLCRVAFPECQCMLNGTGALKPLPQVELDTLALNDSKLVVPVGFEPTTRDLKGRYSTAELRNQNGADSPKRPIEIV